MDIQINEELKQQAKEIMQPQILSMMDTNGKKVDFEVVSMISLEKRLFFIVKNPRAKEGVGKLALFEYITIPVEGEGGRYVLIKDKSIIARVNEEYNKRIRAMDESGLIPRVDD